MVVGVLHFVAIGRPLISVAPVMFYAVMSTYIWVPIALLAWRERASARAVVDLRDSDAASAVAA
jgi:hypothetical protein